MSNSLNRVELLGHLGADPESKFTALGIPVTTFRVATNHRYKNTAGEEQEETEWTGIVAWRKLAELCTSYLQKGSKVYVAGRLRTRSWEDEAGQTRYRTEVQAEEVLFLDIRVQEVEQE
jgi:single-strand DNA-binding protein